MSDSPGAEEPLLGSSNDAEVGNAYKFPAKSVFITFVIVLILALVVSLAIYFVAGPKLEKLTHPEAAGKAGGTGGDKASQDGDTAGDKAGKDGDTAGDKAGKDGDTAGDKGGKGGDTAAYGGDIPDCGTSMTAKQRKFVLEEHNKYRSKVAKGEYTIESSKGKYRSLPRATKMYKLKYNCSLEKSAVNWAIKTKCVMEHTKGASYGENLYLAWGEESPDRKDQAAVNAPGAWSQEISKHGISTLDEWSLDIGHATQVFAARTKSIGCGIHSCGDKVSLVCHYDPRGNILSTNMYTAGNTLSECGKNASNEYPDEGTGLCIWS